MSTTSEDLFKSWFEEPLALLYPHRNAGIAVFMISVPLAERYLRQKCNLGPDADLSDDFMTRLTRLFPALVDVPTARQFWAAYRHGFLHQATLSTSTRRGVPLPVGWFTHDITEAIQIMSDGNFCMHPVIFSQTIVRQIKSDLAAFAGILASAPPLPSVEFFHPVSTHSMPIGTRGG